MTTEKTRPDRMQDRPCRRGTVLEVERIRPRWHRIRIGGFDLSGWVSYPGQHVGVVVNGDPSSGEGSEFRSYSVQSIDRDEATFDLCVLDHGIDSPGSRWSGWATVGDDVMFSGPRRAFSVRADAPYYVFVGEETSQVAFASLLSTVPRTSLVRGVIEIADPEDRLDFPRAEELSWRLRGDEPATSSTALVEAVRALDLPAMPGLAYVAGEARACTEVRRHLIDERNWTAGDRRSILARPFWASGKCGLE